MAREPHAGHQRADPPARDPRSLRVALLLAALFALGCWLRLSAREVHSFWFDETGTTYVAESADPLAILRLDRHPPLSFLAFRGWIALGGADDGWLRLLPALVSCVSLASFALAARLWLGVERGAWALALWAVAPDATGIAHEARMYVGVELAASAAMCLVHVWLVRPRSRPLVLVALALVEAFALGTHYFGALVGASVLASALVARPSPGARALVVLGAAIAVGALAWTPWAALVMPDQFAAPWPFFARTSALDVAKFPARLLVASTSWQQGIGRAAALALSGVATLGLALGAARALRHDPERRALAWFLAPPLASLAIALVGPLCFLPRYLGAATGGLVLVVVAGLHALRPRALGCAALALLCASSLTVALRQRVSNQREDLRTACAEVAAAWRPGDVVACVACLADWGERSALAHHLRGRPEILASIVSSAEVAEIVGPKRVHVVWREAPYCTSVWKRLIERSIARDESPVRWGIRRGTFVLER